MFSVPRRLLSTAVAVLLVAPAWSQLTPGDIAVTGSSGGGFAILSPSGSVTTYPVSLGGGSSHSILWDPTNPTDFYIGGFAFVGRATITGPGTSSYTLLTSAIAQADQMSFDGSGDLMIAEGGTGDQLQRVATSTGAVTPITAGSQPWGTTLNAGARDPSTGDIYVGNITDIYRLPGGTGPAVSFATGFGFFPNGIAFDPQNGDVIAAIGSSSRVLRIDGSGSYTDIIPAGAIANPGSLTFDINGDLLVTGSGTSVFRIPVGTSTPVLIDNVTGLGTILTGIAVHAPMALPAAVIPYGSGCLGSNSVPVLGATQLPFIGNAAFNFQISQALAGSNAYLYLALAPATPAVNLGLGCFLHLDPTSLAQIISTGFAPIGPIPTNAVGTGTIPIPVPNDPGLAGNSVFAQAAIIDPASTIGLALTNGLEALIN